MNKDDFYIVESKPQTFWKPFLVILTEILIFLTIFFLICFTSKKAVMENENPRYKYFTCIHVKEGDTLWDIAKIYRTEEYSSLQSYIDEVKEINHLSSDKITEGMYLTVPYYSSEYKT